MAVHGVMALPDGGALCMAALARTEAGCTSGPTLWVCARALPCPHHPERQPGTAANTATLDGSPLAGLEAT